MKSRFVSTQTLHSALELTTCTQVENESRAQLPSKQGTSPEQTSVLEESIFKISGQISTISRNQKYFRTRENRNFATVQSTEGRIVNFSLIQIALIISMGALQVFVVRFFFQVYPAQGSGFMVTSADNAFRERARVMSKMHEFMNLGLCFTGRMINGEKQHCREGCAVLGYREYVTTGTGGTCLSLVRAGTIFVHKYTI